jgi:DnaD/phage-associated family protein
LLAKLGAIDAELWENKIVWSQNYVDGISDVYKNRRTEIPSRPSFYIEKPHDADISTGENPQSKVKKSKEEKSNVSHKKIIDSLRKNVRADIRKDEIDLVTSWLDDGIETDVVIWAIEQAATNKKRNVQYINGILRNLHSENVLTMEGVKERKKSHKKPEKEERFDFEKYKEEALRLVAKYDDAI